MHRSVFKTVSVFGGVVLVVVVSLAVSGWNRHSKCFGKIPALTVGRSSRKLLCSISAWTVNKKGIRVSEEVENVSEVWLRSAVLMCSNARTNIENLCAENGLICVN